VEAEQCLTLHVPVPVAVIGSAHRCVLEADSECSFNGELFGMTDREIRALEPRHRVVLELVWEAIEAAGYAPAGFADSATAVFAGLSDSPQGRHDPLSASTGMLAGRICHLLDLRGPAAAVDAAAASFLFAIHQAAQSLDALECDVAVVCGVDACGESRAGFDACVLVMKGLPDAVAARDHIVAVVHETMAGGTGSTDSAADSAVRGIVAALASPAGCSPEAPARLRIRRSGPTNVTVAIEPITMRPPAVAPATSELVSLSGQTESDVRELAGRLADHLQHVPAEEFAHHCATARLSRTSFRYRTSLMAQSPEDGAAQLRAVAMANAGASPVMRTTTPPKVALLYAGHGGTSSALGCFLYGSEPVFRRAWDRCARLAQPLLGRPLADAFEPCEAHLDLSLAHVALFAFQWALTAQWRSWGVRADVVLGHSAGECVAACIAGAIGLGQAVALTATRGRLMQSLPSGGGMLSVHAGEQEVAARLAGLGLSAWIAARNAPARIAVSGTQSSLARLRVLLDEDGIEHRDLQVPLAAHSPLVEPLVEPLRAAAAEWHGIPSRVTLVSSLTGAEVDSSHPLTAAHWCRHLREPVNFRDAVAVVILHGCQVLLEIGPDTTLTTLARECAGGTSDVAALASFGSGRDPRERLLDTLGALFMRGGAPHWHRVSRPGRLHRVALPPSVIGRSASGGVARIANLPATDRTRPRTLDEIATQIRSCVATVIGGDVSALGDDDHLLSSGLDSLRVVECMGMLAASLAVRCGADDLMAAPTARALAARLLARMQSGGAPVPAGSLIQLQPGGDRIAIVCPHPSGGRAVSYLGLTALIGREHPCYAVQSRAVDGRATEHETLSGMAADYAAIVGNQVHGPLALVGWSMGALLAHAMAEVLEAAGREIRLVGLIDPTLLHAATSAADAERFARRALARESGSHDGGADRASLDLYNRHFQLVRAHTPGVIDAPVVVWWADRESSSVDWTTRTRGGIEQRAVGGDHFSVMRPPIVTEIANELRRRCQ
jgi:thioesterase domain-containing protein/malonyl CoA-acyl carrier protein transacylase/aryl carrier-like protein